MLIVLLSSGCAGAGSGKNSSYGQSYYASIGDSFRGEFLGVTDQILVIKYRYELSRAEESPRQIYLETAWKDRAILADEVELGVGQAWTRIIIRANVRTTGRYKISLYAENEFQYEESGERRSGPISGELRRYFDQIAGDLRHEFKLLY